REPKPFRKAAFAAKRGQHVHSVDVLGCADLSCGEHSRQDVDVANATFKATASDETSRRPTDGGTHPCSALIDAEFAASPRCVAAADVRNASIVTEEPNERVVGVRSRFDSRQNATNSL